MWSLELFNLIVFPRPDGVIFQNRSGWSSFDSSRLFAYTDPAVKDRFESTLESLCDLPTLVVAEVYDERSTPGFLSRIYDIRRTDKETHFRFEHLTEQLSSEEVFNCGYLDINTGPSRINERNHTHWAVKRGNLVESILRLFNDRSERQRPKLFNLERWPLPIKNHIAVMMPFDQSFEPVYAAIRTACNRRGLQTLRVDEIYTPTPVIQDIVVTIAQSKLVVADLTGRNPNVLYETGLAHSFNRDVIMIAQRKEDVPFDLDHIRFIPYRADQAGFRSLSTKLAEWLN